MHLPDFTPKRLVAEATLAYNLRHADAEQIDSDTAPWPDLTNIILAHLRHAWTNNDQRLSGDYNPELRDELAAKVARAAYRKYPWLRTDPRPFPRVTVTQLAFDAAAIDLASLHSQADQVAIAIRDLRRLPRTPEVKARLQDLAEILTGMRTAIAERSRLFAPVEPNTAGYYVAVRSPEHFGQYSFNGRDLPMNYRDFVGFDCPNCDCAVMRTKRPTDFGQRRRLNTYSCGCLSYALDPPPPGHTYGFVVDVALWTSLIESTYQTDKPEPVDDESDKVALDA